MRIEFEFVYEAELEAYERRTYRDVFVTETRDVADAEAPVVARVRTSDWIVPFEIRHHEGRFYRSFIAYDAGEYHPLKASRLDDPTFRKMLEQTLKDDAKAPLNIGGEVKRKGVPDPTRTKHSDRDDNLAKMQACTEDPLVVDDVLFLPVRMPRWIYGEERDSYGRETSGRCIDWRREGKWFDAVGLEETDIVQARAEVDPSAGRLTGPTVEIAKPEFFLSGVDPEAQLGRDIKGLLSAVARNIVDLPLDAMHAYADVRDTLNAMGYGKPVEDNLLDMTRKLVDLLPRDGSVPFPSRQIDWMEIDMRRFGRGDLVPALTDDTAYAGFAF
jgi:hypothetical protein